MNIHLILEMTKMIEDFSSSDSFDASSQRMLPTPAEMVLSLDRYVVGQERAKQDLAVAIYNHYISVAYADFPESEHPDLGPQHILLIGPTGSGKTYMVRRIADLLGVPVAFASATALVEVGYKGESVDSLLRNLLSLTDGDTFKAERGIIYIDEFDKIRRARGDIVRDVSGEGVQNALLTLLDGRRTTITEHSASRNSTIDVSKILFICTGAFSDLPDIVRKRVDSGRGFGFGKSVRGSHQPNLETDDHAYAEAVPEDLIEFGFIPEIIGRFATITTLKSLTDEQMVQVLTDVRGSILAKQKTFFALHGIELIVPQQSLLAIARKSRELAAGARGLVRLMLNALDDVDFRLPELHDDGVDRIIVTPQTVLRTGKPILLKRGEGIPPEWSLPEPGTVTADTKSASVNLPDVQTLRSRALYPARLLLNTHTTLRESSSAITDTRGWTTQQIRDKISSVRDQLGYKDAHKSARKWWDLFEIQNSSQERLVLRFAEELASRKATIGEFYESYLRCKSDNLAASLHFYDYERVKKMDESRKKDDGHDSSPDSISDNDDDSSPQSLL
jgi:ATP-dependent Clp protease ATP-binding subunit ClpX